MIRRNKNMKIHKETISNDEKGMHRNMHSFSALFWLFSVICVFVCIFTAAVFSVVSYAEELNEFQPIVELIAAAQNGMTESALLTEPGEEPGSETPEPTEQWEENEKKLRLIATGTDSGIVTGVKTGQYYELTDGTDLISSGLISEDNSSGLVLQHVEPGYTVRIFPSEEEKEKQDADLRKWEKEFLANDILPDTSTFSVSPVTVAGELHDGSIAFSNPEYGSRFQFKAVYMNSDSVAEGESFLSENGEIRGLPSGKYQVRVEPAESMLASEWVELEVGEPTEYTVTIENLSVEGASVSVSKNKPPDDPEAESIESGDRVFPTEKIYVQVTVPEDYLLEGVTFTAADASPVTKLSEEAEDGFFAYTMPEADLQICVILKEKTSGSEETPEEEKEEEPKDEDEPEEDGKNYVTAIRFSRNEDTIALGGGAHVYTYIVEPEDAEDTINWTCDRQDTVRVQVDSINRKIVISPKCAGTAVLKAVSGENKSVIEMLTVIVYEDNSGHNSDFYQSSFTYLTEEGNWFYDNPTDFSVRCSGLRTMLDQILIDGYIIPQYSSGQLNWSLSDTDDTAVNFSKAFMFSLPKGNHTLTVTYINGVSASTTIRVQSKYAVPRTGDDFCLWREIILMTFTAGAAVVVWSKKRHSM